jgi:hypothetical protein
MRQVVDGLALWHQFVRERDPQVLEAALAEDAVFHSPVVYKPVTGRAVVMPYLLGAVRVLEDFSYVRAFSREDGAVLEFNARVGDRSVHGVDIIQLNADGRISDFAVMVRPASGLEALRLAMGRLLSVIP